MQRRKLMQDYADFTNSKNPLIVSEKGKNNDRNTYNFPEGYSLFIEISDRRNVLNFEDKSV
jgi:hypothetical protein